MQKRVGGLEEFEFEPLTSGHSLHVTIAISGWLTNKHPGNQITAHTITGNHCSQSQVVTAHNHRKSLLTVTANHCSQSQVLTAHNHS